jgi:hypothetical protein
LYVLRLCVAPPSMAFALHAYNKNKSPIFTSNRYVQPWLPPTPKEFCFLVRLIDWSSMRMGGLMSQPFFQFAGRTSTI